MPRKKKTVKSKQTCRKRENEKMSRSQQKRGGGGGSSRMLAKAAAATAAGVVVGAAAGAVAGIAMRGRDKAMMRAVRQQMLQDAASASADTVLKCCICMEHTVDTALKPCFHAQFCNECADHLLTQRSPSRPICPICRGDITGKQKIYLGGRRTRRRHHRVRTKKAHKKRPASSKKAHKKRQARSRRK